MKESMNQFECLGLQLAEYQTCLLHVKDPVPSTFLKNDFFSEPAGI